MLREFKNRDGARWRVWDVIPTLHADNLPRSAKRFSKVPAGWLCFESETQRRRLSPIPAGWEELDDAALEQLCDQAELVGPRARDRDIGATP